ncbi:hypothetical protein HZU77_016115, partial [Neisseriaceae bacterium TC5R-5]|nr:hypothetical protein [Neisseriaceae bacterium TC5R-5]
ITKSQNHKITKSQNHKITKSQNHKITKSQNHKITKSQNHKITKKYKGLNERVYADFDNECIFDANIVGLTFTEEVENFHGEKIHLQEGEYIYLYMGIDKFLPEYVVAEGHVISNPYSSRQYKWCCKLVGDIEYLENYNKRFGISVDE